jgi:hypothetical protein
VSCEFEHVLRDLHVLDVIEIFFWIANFVRVAQQRPHQTLVERFQRDDVLPIGQHHATDGDLVHLADRLTDHGVGIVTDLAIRSEIVGTDHEARVDLAAVDELVDLDRPGRFQGDVLEFVLRHFDEGVRVDLVALDDVLVGDLLAGVGVHLGILDAVAGLAVELIERDLLGLRCGRVERDRTIDERKAKEAFPVCAGGHGTRYSEARAVRTQDERGALVPTPEMPSRDHFSQFDLRRTRLPCS